MSLSGITEELDRESYEWLYTNRPTLADELEGAVKSGHSPNEIRRHIMRETQRNELSLRCLQAARHIQRTKEW